MIAEDWGDDTNYGGLVFCKLTAVTVVEKKYALSQSGGHISPTWVLLDNQSNMDFSQTDVS